MATSPKSGLGARDSWFGKLSTSVGSLTPRKRRLSCWISRSLTKATPIVPRARAGATRRSHAARPGARTRRPRPSLTRTRSGGTAGERFVRFDNLLDELVADDVAVVEVDERDALDVADDLHRFDQSRR